MSVRRLGIFLACLAGVGLPITSPAVSSYVAADPSAPRVTPENLFTSERYWPYQVELIEAWTPAGRSDPLPAGLRGVLIRVEPAGSARIDLGRDGVHDVPVGRTDLVRRANAVRLGELAKVAPNLTHAIGPRLIDPEPDEIRSFDFARTFDAPGFLCVFADPSAEAFPALAADLAPLRGRHRVLTVLLPEGRYPHDQTRQRLRALGWPVPFVMDQLSEGYAESLLPEGASLPEVMLMTEEGRVVFQSGWKAGVGAELAAALDRAFADLPARTPDPNRAPAP